MQADLDLVVEANDGDGKADIEAVVSEFGFAVLFFYFRFMKI